MELNSEQIEYLKGLDSKKKQRKFLLDCLVGSITSIGKSVKISDMPITKEVLDSDDFRITTKPPLGIKPLWVCNYLRLQEINNAISRYEFVGKEIPKEWIEEKQEIELYPYGRNKSDEIANSSKPLEKDELLKFDAMDKKENMFNWYKGEFANVKENPLKKGEKIKIFNKEYLITDEDEIGFTIVETKKDVEEDIEISFLCEIKDYLGDKLMPLEINEVQDLEKIFLKYHEIANPKKKYTEEDMRNCFEQSRLAHPMLGFKHESFAKYLDSLEK